MAVEERFFAFKILEHEEGPQDDVLAVERFLFTEIVAKLRLFIALNVENDPGAEELFGGVDEDDGIDGLARVVGGFIEFNLDLGRDLVAHRFVIKYDWESI